jgi:hypothetical protein
MRRGCSPRRHRQHRLEDDDDADDGDSLALESRSDGARLGTHSRARSRVFRSDRSTGRSALRRATTTRRSAHNARAGSSARALDRALGPPTRAREHPPGSRRTRESATDGAATDGAATGAAARPELAPSLDPSRRSEPQSLGRQGRHTIRYTPIRRAGLSSVLAHCGARRAGEAALLSVSARGVTFRTSITPAAWRASPC